MIRVKAEPMSGNPAAKRIGDKSGLWKVVIYDYGTGSYIDPNLRGKTHSENLGYDEAQETASALERNLNSN